jgi:hypothetical protein
MRFIIEETDEHLTSHAGLALVGALLEKTDLRRRLDGVKLVAGRKRAEISNGDNAVAMIGLLCLGKPDFDAIEAFRAEPFFAMALGMSRTPSSPTLRQRVEKAGNRFDAIVREESAKLLRAMKPKLTPCLGERVALDVDVSPFDNSNTKKEGVSCTYKKVDGYAPAFAYLGEEGYLIHAELREGKTHCQSGMETFLTEAFELAEMAGATRLLARLDSGNDSLGNIAVCIEHEQDWLIKRNLRQESAAGWLDVATAQGEPEWPREGKEVWHGETWVKREDIDRPLRIVYRATRRTVLANGQRLLIPEVEVDTWWTSLPHDPRTVVELYCGHGTCEQFHSELKTDMDLERLPSGKFQANALVLLLGMIAYNLLRLIGQESLNAAVSPRRRNVARRRLRTVMQDLIYLACRVVRHARRTALQLSRWSAWRNVWMGVHLAFAAA